jgi:DNA-binding response OmpR family regulator
MFGAAGLPAFGPMLGNGKDPLETALGCDDGRVQILLVEDDTRLSALVAQRLRREGHEAETAADGIEGLRLAETGRFDLAVLDVMLPGMDGLSMASALRARDDRLPILLLTARDTIDDRVRGLRAGADDYLVKPFAFAELLARIEALGRRSAPTPAAALVQGAVRLDPRARRVTVDGNEVELTAKEFDLLRCLMDHAGRVLSRSELKEQVWDFTFDAQTKVVDLYVHYLRRKLGPAGDIIETVRGVGYAVGR